MTPPEPGPPPGPVPPEPSQPSQASQPSGTPGSPGAPDAPATRAVRPRRAELLGRFLRPLPGARPRPRFEVPPEERASAERSPSSWAEPARPVQTGFLLAVGVGLALLCWWVLANVGPLVGWVVTATFLALGLEPLVRWLETRGVPRPGAVLLVVLALAGAFALLIVVVVPRVVAEASLLAGRVPQLIDDFLGSEAFERLDRQLRIRDSTEQWVQDLSGRIAADQDFLGGLFGGVVGVGTVVLNVLAGTLIVLALTLYFLFSLPIMTQWAYRLAPASGRARVQELGDQMVRGVGNYVVGQTCVALLNAAVALVLMTVTGVPFAALLVVFVAVLAFVPLVGGVLAGLLVTLVALTADWGTALPYAIGYFAYLQVEAYFVSPRIMRRAVAVPGAIAVIAVAAGGALWGVLGALIAIPTAAAGLLLVREVFVPRQDRR
ncbi:AI-2E family transporter [Kocuria dechangensis]|uniref:AI-2E family transporter n=1 Tax=Kocuria dechangensis TaxID=1176249 RepID=A0A917GUE0_9MICC|nr:AI-2E family transporter [Kocuria dechangensis]GGG57488.1 AI-2E family transporter [Kocuria dechangensis]